MAIKTRSGAPVDDRCTQYIKPDPPAPSELQTVLPFLQEVAALACVVAFLVIPLIRVLLDVVFLVRFCGVCLLFRQLSDPTTSSFVRTRGSDCCGCARRQSRRGRWQRPGGQRRSQGGNGFTSGGAKRSSPTAGLRRPAYARRPNHVVSGHFDRPGRRIERTSLKRLFFGHEFQ